MTHFKSELGEKVHPIVDVFKLFNKVFTKLEKFVEPKNNIIAAKFRFFKR